MTNGILRGFSPSSSRWWRATIDFHVETVTNIFIEIGKWLVKGSNDGRDGEFSESVLDGGEGAVVQRFV